MPELPEHPDVAAERRRLARDLAAAAPAPASAPADPLDDPEPHGPGDHDTPPPRGPPDLPLLLTVGEVARELRLSERQIYNLASQSRLEIVRIGRSVRFTRASVLALASATATAI
jgi:excisionase family DNA binding protein